MRTAYCFARVRSPPAVQQRRARTHRIAPNTCEGEGGKGTWESDGRGRRVVRDGLAGGADGAFRDVPLTVCVEACATARMLRRCPSSLSWAIALASEMTGCFGLGPVLEIGISFSSRSSSYVTWRSEIFGDAISRGELSRGGGSGREAASPAASRVRIAAEPVAADVWIHKLDDAWKGAPAGPSSAAQPEAERAGGMRAVGMCADAACADEAHGPDALNDCACILRSSEPDSWCGCDGSGLDCV